MEKVVGQLTLLGLLLALGSTLPNKEDWDIYYYHINSTVTDRYAATVITSRVANRRDEPTEIEFHVKISKNAFISGFKMSIEGQVYNGVVKAKEEAQQQYSEAVSRGQSAGLVSSVGRTLEEFKTSVTVAAHQKVTFELTYEELLRRRLGQYELQIYARPMQPVDDFKLDVSFSPTAEQQTSCGACGEDGLNGDLVIVYDVSRDDNLGDLKKSDGYFVHHFAPSGLPSIPKNVIFIIDQSGSMYGRKMLQTRAALVHILADLTTEDFFGLITFNHGIHPWKRELVQANQHNVGIAKAFARGIQDGGWETNLERIRENVRKAIAKKFPLYCLGFGHDVNFEFLEKMSLENNGAARRIYDDSDADLQLKGFYAEVATPLLTDVMMIYEGGANLTQTNFNQYYNGSEIVVAGQIMDNSIETFSPQVVAISSNIRRLWAYLTVKQLLDKQLQLNGTEKQRAKKEALELSLKYSFVTPLTSMVVTKPPGENTQVLHKPREGAQPPAQGAPASQPRGSQPRRSQPRGSQPRASQLRDYQPTVAPVSYKVNSQVLFPAVIVNGQQFYVSEASSVDVDMSGQFSTAELRAAIGNLRQGKSPGHDNIHPEFVTHQSETTSAWLCSFFSSCFQRSKLPKTWRRAAVIALLKPGKTAEDPKAYRPISLLCVPFKILERMILSRIEPVVDPQLPREQAGFRRGRSTVDQVTLLTQDIEDSFQAKEKVGVVLLDLTAAYDTVWHRGLHLKLLRTIPDRHMVKFIMEMLSNRSFILRTSDGQRSRLRRLRNGVPQGSVLSPLLFNIYIHDLPETTSRQYGYADDLAIMLRRTTWSAVEQGLNQDMSILAAYLRKWRLQLSTGKTVSAAYHLCNGEAKRELSVSVDNKRLEHQLAPKYLGVRLDRTLSYKRHLEEVRAKVTARVSLIRRLAGTTWGASARTLRISTQALVFSAAEYCAPVWSRSPHVKKTHLALPFSIRKTAPGSEGDIPVAPLLPSGYSQRSGTGPLL
ncbi:hypothetical protein NHX12_029840 [Muraenolepis orangiensis]|uniref:Uncharacterized protein n=1 Tax=Muraenolepis orangiensis TaxID=630683 RepID=A0A9Q0IL59_9TELE|nr:hypothetical protein NHX12_029840 [Muraenolepis orangiensis]